MTSDEAERLAREILDRTNAAGSQMAEFNAGHVQALCDFILSGDYKRESAGDFERTSSSRNFFSVEALAATVGEILPAKEG